jgi:NADH pyrophosphatase NudC (nudix superfamily)
MTPAREVSVKTSGDLVVSSPTLPSWQLFALAGLVGATLAVFVSRGQSPAAIILLSLVVFAAAAVGAAALRTLAPFIGGQEALAVPIVAGRARGAVEREKTLALRAIKELEFDHAMGKVSDQDFADMGLRLRTRAAGLMRQLDAGAAYATQIDQEIARRLAAAGAAATADAPASRFCTECGAPTAAAARFCGQCGHRLETA